MFDLAAHQDPAAMRTLIERHDLAVKMLFHAALPNMEKLYSRRMSPDVDWIGMMAGIVAFDSTADEALRDTCLEVIALGFLHDTVRPTAAAVLALMEGHPDNTLAQLTGVMVLVSISRDKPPDGALQHMKNVLRRGASPTIAAAFVAALTEWLKTEQGVASCRAARIADLVATQLRSSHAVNNFHYAFVLSKLIGTLSAAMQMEVARFAADLIMGPSLTPSNAIFILHRLTLNSPKLGSRFPSLFAELLERVKVVHRIPALCGTMLIGTVANMASAQKTLPSTLCDDFVSYMLKFPLDPLVQSSACHAIHVVSALSVPPRDVDRTIRAAEAAIAALPDVAYVQSNANALLAFLRSKDKTVRRLPVDAFEAERVARELIEEEERAKAAAAARSRSKKKDFAKPPSEAPQPDTAPLMQPPTPPELATQLDNATPPHIPEFLRSLQQAPPPPPVTAPVPLESLPVFLRPSAPQPVDDEECIMCMERRRETIFVPCGHFQLCKACVATLRLEADARGAQLQCPTCREGVHMALDATQ